MGDSHKEPEIPCYNVQKLNRLMERMINYELTGRYPEARAEDVLFNVGGARNGICSLSQSRQARIY